MKEREIGRRKLQEGPEIISAVSQIEAIKKDALEMFYGKEKDIEVEIVDQADEFGKLLLFDAQSLLENESVDIDNLYSMIFMTYEGKKAVRIVEGYHQQLTNTRKQAFRDALS